MTILDRLSTLNMRYLLAPANIPDNVRVITEVGADADLASPSTIPTGRHVIVTSNLLSTASSTAGSFPSTGYLR